MATSDHGELAQWLSEAARKLESTRGTPATLDEVCRVAVAVIAGCTSAGISEDHRERRGETLATSDDTASALHTVQHDIGEGPCLTAMWRERVVWSDELAEDERWPNFGAKAAAYGVRSMVAIQLYTFGDSFGALNLFSDQPGAFDEVTRDVAQIYAAPTAAVLAAARENAGLSQALTTRQRIGQATGILAERHGITTDEAFALLVQSSNRHNIKIRDLADRMVTSEDSTRRDSV